MQAEFLQEIIAIQKVAFNRKVLQEVFNNHTLEQTIDLLTIQNKEQLKIVIDYIQALLEDDEIYQKVLLSENGTTFIQALLSHQNKKVRELLGICIETHQYDFAQLLTKLIEQNKPVELYLQVLFYQIADNEPEVGLKALRISKKIFSRPNLHLQTLMQDQIFIKYLQNGLQSKDEVIQLRFVEALISFAGTNDQVFEAMKPLFSTVFKLYNSNDILVKLNMIEIISAMGNSKHTAEFLQTQPFFKDIIKEAFQQDLDFYIRKYQVILLSMLISQRVIKSTNQLEAKLVNLLQRWLSGNNQEELEGALEVVKYFGAVTEGFKAICDSKDFLYTYLRYALSTKDIIKKKFLSSIVGLFAVDTVIQKPPGKICWVFAQLGKNQISADFDQGQLKASVEYVLQLLNSPFADFELLAIELLSVTVTVEEIFKNLMANDKFKGYFLKYSQNKEILDAKQELKNFVLHLCQNAYKADQYVSFAQELQSQKLQQEIDILKKLKMKLTRDFFMNMTRLENAMLTSKNQSMKSVDNLINMYSQCVEFYDQQQDPIKYYFLDKIQYTLAQDKTIETMINKGDDLPIDQDLKMTASVRSKQTMHKIKVIQETQPRQNYQLSNILDGYSNQIEVKDQMIKNQLGDQQSKFKERLLRRSLSIRGLNATLSEDNLKKEEQIATTKNKEQQQIAQARQDFYMFQS